MSSYIDKLKHPKSGKYLKALCLDNFYGRRRYGYGFRKDGKDVTLDYNMKDLEFFDKYEITWDYIDT